MNLKSRLTTFVTSKINAFRTKDAVDQIIVMFIIIAVAAGIAGLLYIFGTKTFLPNFEGKVTSLVNEWFSSK